LQNSGWAGTRRGDGAPAGAERGRRVEVRLGGAGAERGRRVEARPGGMEAGGAEEGGAMAAEGNRREEEEDRVTDKRDPRNGA